jgi:hypothetical protein
MKLLITVFRNDIQLVIEGCAVDEKYTSIYATGLGSSTRFAFDTTNPEFDYLSYQDSPYYLHCEVRLNFLDNFSFLLNSTLS